MSAHPHPHGDLVNENVHHEESDINVRAIITFIVVLFAIALSINVAMYGLLVLFNKIADRTEAAVSPLTAPAASQGSDFPAPGLQTTPWGDLTRLRAEEAAHLHGFGWVDEAGGVGHIPIERAKAMLLEKGLPVRPNPVDPTFGTRVSATGDSSGGRTLPGGEPDRSSPSAGGASGAPGAGGATGGGTPQADAAAPKKPGGGA